MNFTPAGIPVDDRTEDDLTPEDWAASEGAHERRLAEMLANPEAAARYHATLAEIRAHVAARADQETPR